VAQARDLAVGGGDSPANIRGSMNCKFATVNIKQSGPPSSTSLRIEMELCSNGADVVTTNAQLGFDLVRRLSRVARLVYLSTGHLQVASAIGFRRIEKFQTMANLSDLMDAGRRCATSRSLRKTFPLVSL
jgi:hypothetical protein